MNRFLILAQTVLILNFLIPMLVVANISAEVAHWSVRGTNGFDLLGCDDVHVTLWTI